MENDVKEMKLMTVLEELKEAAREFMEENCGERGEQKDNLGAILK